MHGRRARDPRCRAGHPGPRRARHVAPHVSILQRRRSASSRIRRRACSTCADDPRSARATLGTACVAIVGDVRHSRVARSAAQALSTLGVGEFRLVAPASADARCGRVPGARSASTHWRRASAGADVIMSAADPARAHGRERRSRTPTRISREFGITRERRLARAPDAIVHAPGADESWRRDRETTSPTAPQSAIQQQVTNGVAVRMAVLSRRSCATCQVRNIEAGRRPDDRPRGHRGTISSSKTPSCLRNMSTRDGSSSSGCSAPPLLPRPLPGSFAHLSCDAQLPMRRPLSIMRADARRRLDRAFCTRSSAPVSEALSQQPVGHYAQRARADRPRASPPDTSAAAHAADRRRRRASRR